MCPACSTAASSSSTIANGRITHDRRRRGAAVPGVLTVLTHENRPPHGRHRRAYKETCAGRLAVPAAVRRQDPCSTASRSRWSSPRPGVARYRGVAGAGRIRSEQHRHGRFCSASAPRLRAPGSDREQLAPPKTARRCRDEALAASAVRHRGRILRPDRAPQPDGAARHDRGMGGRRQLTVHDKTQGVQNVQRYLAASSA